LQQTVAYVIVQIGGCCMGALLAHAMFEMPLIQASLHLRTGRGQWLSEGVATGGLILVVMGSPGPREAAWRVAAWIGAAYWFTASTSFANPAITIARALSDTFAGIAPAHVPGFIAAQLSGALVGLLLAKYLLYTSTARRPA
jgi:glycerol uptake facilitator-like aquaporin